MMGFPQRGEGNLTRATSLCKNFQPNMFNKTKCQNCFRTREAHDLDGGDGNNVRGNFELREMQKWCN